MATSSETVCEIVHGAATSYSNHGCRCELCKAAYRKTRAERLAKGAPADKHGTISGYRHWGCRCGLCRQAVREDDRRKRLNSDFRSSNVERNKRWREQHPERALELGRRGRLRPHGLSVQDIETMENAQEGLCAICKQPETGTRNGRLKSLAIDHCHKTGRVRALLCAHCNRGIGCFKDNPQLLRAAATYLETL